MLDRNRITLTLAAGLPFVFATAPDASAVEIAFQNGLSNAYVSNYAGTSDTTFNSAGSYQNANMGGADFMQANQTRSWEQAKALLRFDLSALSGEDLQVNSASLILRPVTGGSTENIQVSLLPIAAANAGWTQGTSTGFGSAASPGSATWANKADPATPWAGSAGLSTPDTDYANTPASTGVYDPNSSADITFALPASLVQSWIDTPADNAGLLMLTDVTTSTEGNWWVRFASFFSSEVTNSSLRPTLVLDVTPVPEPASLALLAGGALLALRRRR